MPSDKKKIKFIIRLTASIALLGWLISTTGTASIAQAFYSVPLWAWVLAIASYLTSQIISSIRWQGISTALGFSGSSIRFIKLYFTGMFFNLFLPTSIGGDVLKAVFLSGKGNEGGKMKAGYTVLTDRVFGMAGLFILGSLTVIIFNDLLPFVFSATLVITTLCGIASIILIPKSAEYILKIWPRFKDKVNIMLQLWQIQGTILRAVLLSLPVQFFGITVLAILGDAMDIDVEPAYYFAIFPVIAVLTILPISLSGLGVREGTLACFLAFKDVPEEQAVALGLGFFAVQAVISLVGGLMYVTGTHIEKSQTEVSC